MDIIEQKPQWGINYREGYDGFVTRRRDFIAAGIEWFERWDELPGLPPVTHTFKIIEENKTIEALADGVRFGNIDDYLKDPDGALLVRKPAGWTAGMGFRMSVEAHQYLGERYNYILIAAMAVSNTYFGRHIDNWTHGKFSLWLEGVADRKKTDICSSLIARVDGAMPELKGKSVLALPPFKIMPVMLFGDPVIYTDGAIELIP